MDNQKLTNTPIKLAPGIAREFGRKFKAAIKEHGLAHAVNCVLAKHFGLKEPETPRARMAKAKRQFWAKKKASNKESKTNGD